MTTTEMLISTIQRLENLAAQHKDQYRCLKAQLEKEVVREEFSTGGETIHRGYYCPSPVQDIIVIGSKRGRLLKRLTEKSKPTYKYGFNAKGEMLFAKNLHYGFDFETIELMVRQEHTEIGITFSEEFGIQEVSECVYSNGKLVSYAHGFGPRLRKEDYTYIENGPLEVNIYDYCGLTQHYKYNFQRDEEGYLQSFSLLEYNSNPNAVEGGIHDIKIRRKV